MMKKIKKYLILSCAIPLCFIILVVSMVAGIVSSSESDKVYKTSTDKTFSEPVERYRDKVKEICEEYGVGAYYIDILSIMEHLSGGNGLDVMRASSFESNQNYKGKRIQEPLYSITCGVQEFRTLLSMVSVEDEQQKLLIVYQAYHVGRGYIAYANGSYSLDNATAYISENTLDNKHANFAERIAFLKQSMSESNIKFANGDFGYPFTQAYIITSTFGRRTNPVTGKLEEFHKGTDFGAPAMTPILAIADGTVYACGDVGDGYGCKVVLLHSSNCKSLYAHMTRTNNLQAGQTVSRGEIIGFVGTTGQSTGNHLHLEIIIDGQRVNPTEYITYPGG